MGAKKKYEDLIRGAETADIARAFRIIRKCLTGARQTTLEWCGGAVQEWACIRRR